MKIYLFSNLKSLDTSRDSTVNACLKQQLPDFSLTQPIDDRTTDEWPTRVHGLEPQACRSSRYYRTRLSPCRLVKRNKRDTIRTFAVSTRDLGVSRYFPNTIL